MSAERAHGGGSHRSTPLERADDGATSGFFNLRLVAEKRALPDPSRVPSVVGISTLRVAKVLKNLQMTTMVELLAVGALCRLKIALQDRSSLLGQLERMHRVVFDTSEHLRRFVGPHLSEGPSGYLLDRRL